MAANLVKKIAFEWFVLLLWLRCVCKDNMDGSSSDVNEAGGLKSKTNTWGLKAKAKSKDWSLKATAKDYDPRPRTRKLKLYKHKS